MLILLSSLHQQESSLVGQATLAAEREASTKWQSQLHSYLDGVRGTDPSTVIIAPHSKVSANVAFSGDTSTSSSLRCANPKHSNCTNHESKDCKAEPCHSMWIKGLLNAATGLRYHHDHLLFHQQDLLPKVLEISRNPSIKDLLAHSVNLNQFCRNVLQLTASIPAESRTRMFRDLASLRRLQT